MRAVFILAVLIFVLLVMWRHKVLSVPSHRDPVFLDDQETFLDKPIGYGSEWLSF
jgi:hypothetical protein